MKNIWNKLFDDNSIQYVIFRSKEDRMLDYE